MLLPGRLAHSTLGDVLGTLMRARVSGLLRLVEIGNERTGMAHAVHVVAGVPHAVMSQGSRLGEILRKRGSVGKALVYSALAQQRALGGGRLMGEVLRSMGSARELVDDGIREQTRERLERLFLMRDAELTFHSALLSDVVSPAILRAGRTAPPLTPDEFLHGRARARPRSTSSTSPNEQRRADLLRLGLVESATLDELRAALRRCVAEVHPDRATSDEDRRDRTRRVASFSAAFHRLTQ